MCVLSLLRVIPTINETVDISFFSLQASGTDLGVSVSDIVVIIIIHNKYSYIATE